MLSISTLIEQDLDPLVAEWVDFAHGRVPLAGLSDLELADHAKVLLLAIAVEMRGDQTVEVRHSKSIGNEPDHAPKVTAIAREHAQQRFAQGFSLDHLVAEFRALRASVSRRWTSQLEIVNVAALDDLTRFGESVDQALMESVTWYSSKVNDSRNLLLGVLGHDLRSPLDVVHMTAHYLLRINNLDGTTTKAVARVLTAAERMKGMVNDLLDFTQTALGVPLPVAPTTGDLGEIATAITSEVGTLNPDSPMVITCSGELSGQWDAARIGQMLSNLLSNAVHHGDRSSPVTVRVDGLGDGVLMQVHNEGAPIPPEVQKTLFRPLQQTATGGAAKRAQSSGLSLGLYIAREIAVAHGGSIELSSGGQGTTFSVRLPRTPPSQKPMASASFQQG